MIDVVNKVEVTKAIDIDDEPHWDHNTDTITVRNNRHDASVVVLEIEGKRYAVLAKDLIAAITNASNTGER